MLRELRLSRKHSLVLCIFTSLLFSGCISTNLSPEEKFLCIELTVTPSLDFKECNSEDSCKLQLEKELFDFDLSGLSPESSRLLSAYKSNIANSRLYLSRAIKDIQKINSVCRQVGDIHSVNLIPLANNSKFNLEHSTAFFDSAGKNSIGLLVSEHESFLELDVNLINNEKITNTSTLLAQNISTLLGSKTANLTYAQILKSQAQKIYKLLGTDSNDYYNEQHFFRSTLNEIIKLGKQQGKVYEKKDLFVPLISNAFNSYVTTLIEKLNVQSVISLLKGTESYNLTQELSYSLSNNNSPVSEFSNLVKNSTNAKIYSLKLLNDEFTETFNLYNETNLSLPTITRTNQKINEIVKYNNYLLTGTNSSNYSLTELNSEINGIKERLTQLQKKQLSNEITLGQALSELYELQTILRTINFRIQKIEQENKIWIEKNCFNYLNAEIEKFNGFEQGTLEEIANYLKSSKSFEDKTYWCAKGLEFISNPSNTPIKPQIEDKNIQINSTELLVNTLQKTAKIYENTSTNASVEEGFNVFRSVELDSIERIDQEFEIILKGDYLGFDLINSPEYLSDIKYSNQNTTLKFDSFPKGIIFLEFVGSKSLKSNSKLELVSADFQRAILKKTIEIDNDFEISSLEVVEQVSFDLDVVETALLFDNKEYKTQIQANEISGTIHNFSGKGKIELYYTVQNHLTKSIEINSEEQLGEIVEIKGSFFVKNNLNVNLPEIYIPFTFGAGNEINSFIDSKGNTIDYFIQDNKIHLKIKSFKQSERITIFFNIQSKDFNLAIENVKELLIENLQKPLNSNLTQYPLRANELINLSDTLNQNNFRELSNSLLDESKKLSKELEIETSNTQKKKEAESAQQSKEAVNKLDYFLKLSTLIRESRTHLGILNNELILEVISNIKESILKNDFENTQIKLNEFESIISKDTKEGIDFLEFSKQDYLEILNRLKQTTLLLEQKTTQLEKELKIFETNSKSFNFIPLISLHKIEEYKLKITQYKETISKLESLALPKDLNSPTQIKQFKSNLDLLQNTLNKASELLKNVDLGIYQLKEEASEEITSLIDLDLQGTALILAGEAQEEFESGHSASSIVKSNQAKNEHNQESWVKPYLVVIPLVVAGGFVLLSRNKIKEKPPKFLQRI